MNKLLLTLGLLLAVAGISSAQKPPEPWPPLREADVMYTKRVVRMIDTREKFNQPMRWPKNALHNIIYNAVQDRTIGVYPNEDSMSLENQMDYEIATKLGGYIEIIQVLIDPTDIYAGTIDSPVFVPFDPNKIVKFMIMEDWIYDKKTSEMLPRIIAIAPLYNPVAGSSGFTMPEQPMYWLRYDEARALFAQQKIFQPNTAASAMLTYDDFFEMRMFRSYVIKENNMYDYYVKDFEEFKNDGVAAMLESERIQKELFIMEHDLWDN
jgi:gliding motility associated protien GldN